MKLTHHDKIMGILLLATGIIFYISSLYRAKCGFFDAQCHNEIFAYEFSQILFFGFIVGFGVKKLIGR